MFQELEFHMPRVQTSSYHIYERDSAGDEALRLGSPGDPVPINKYVLLREGGQTCLLHWLPISGSSRFSVGWS